MSKLIYIQDSDPASLAGRIDAFRDEWAEYGIVGWELRATRSRNALLEALVSDAAARQHSVAFVDLRVETGDLEQLGLRVVETIRRHPEVARVCRPIVMTEEMTVANAQAANGVGAYAVIDTTWAYDAPGAVYTSLADDVLSQRAGDFRVHRTKVALIPERGADLGDESEDLARNFLAWFDFDATDLHLALLWGMANAVELEYLKQYLTEVEVAGTVRIAKRELERLQAAMALHIEAMDRPETARTEIARRFLAEAIPPQPDPNPELSWPMLEHVRTVWRSQPTVVRAAHLEPGGAQLLAHFFDSLDTVKGGAHERRAAIDRAVIAAAKAESLAPTAASIVVQRCLHALDDAWADHRDHGAGAAFVRHVR